MSKSLKSIICIGAMVLVVAISIIYSNFFSHTSSKVEEKTYDVTSPLPKSGEVNGIKYSYVTSYYGNKKYDTRGYYLDTLNQPNAPWYVIVTSGVKYTGGYGIVLLDIYKDEDNKTVIVVGETEPAYNQVVTQALTYPTITIELGHEYGNFKVVDINGNVYRSLN